jgi:hypothetical protein
MDASPRHSTADRMIDFQEIFKLASPRVLRSGIDSKQALP